MKISIFGLGYVGCVTAACLANEGHKVAGVDVNQVKVNLINSGKSPIVEPGLDTIISEVVRNGNLTVGTDASAAVLESDISLVCVGTPSNTNGNLNYMYVENVCRHIGTAMHSTTKYHVVVIRSTVLPGTVEEKLIPILEGCSNKRAGIDFGVCMNPEFLREGTAIKDFYHPGMVVIGELDEKSGEMAQELYKNIDAPFVRTSIKIAEMVKYTCNAFHALKVVFSNEIGSLCKAQGIDGQKVMETFMLDQQLNISPKYLMPGFAFGGSCLPKDVRAMAYRAKEVDVESPLLNSILPSNHLHIQKAINMIEQTGKKEIGILGLSFKPNTDDLRESPAVVVVETLLGRGYHVHVYDEKLELSNLVGANKLFLEKEIPHIANLLYDSVDEIMNLSDVIVVTNSSGVYQEAVAQVNRDKILIDLVGAVKESSKLVDEYIGICW